MATRTGHLDTGGPSYLTEVFHNNVFNSLQVLN